jgi:hypothetical protein
MNWLKNIIIKINKPLLWIEQTQEPKKIKFEPDSLQSLMELWKIYEFNYNPEVIDVLNDFLVQVY